MHDQGAPSPQPRVWVPGGGSYCTVTDGGCASAVGVQVFNEYLQDISAIKTSDSGQRVACCGDCSVKVVHRTGMEFEAPRACGQKRVWPQAAWSPRRRACTHMLCLFAAGFARGEPGSQAHDRRVPRQGAFAIHLPPPPPRVHACPLANTTVPQVEWDDTATGFACSATDGFLYVHELLGV